MEGRPQTTAVAAITIGLAIAGPQGTVAADTRELTSIHVAIVNHAGVPEELWQRGQTTASRIYEAAGIKVLWIDRAATAGVSSLQSDLTIIVSAAPSAPGLTSSKHVLGFAGGAAESWATCLCLLWTHSGLRGKNRYGHRHRPRPRHGARDRSSPAFTERPLVGWPDAGSMGRVGDRTGN